MIGLDTNVLIRYLTQDDAAQSALATSLFEDTFSKDCPGFLNLVVLCEVVWVLEVCYKQTRQDIVRVIQQLLRVAELQIQAADVVRVALSDFEEGNADFSDNLIARLNFTQGCEFTYSFDKKASRQLGFKLLAASA